MPSTAPIDLLDEDPEDEYVEMTPTQPSENSKEWGWSNNRKHLASLYSPSNTGSKTKCTVAKSSVQHVLESTSVMATSQNVAHVDSSSETSPTHISASSPRSLDNSPAHQRASISSSDCSPLRAASLTQTTPLFYAHRPIPAGDTLESGDPHSESMYSNVAPEIATPPIPPRDIKRKYPIRLDSSPLIKFPISFHQQGNERSQGVNEYTLPPTTAHLPQGQTSEAVSLHDQPRPQPAPKPKKKAKPGTNLICIYTCLHHTMVSCMHVLIN